MGGPLAVLRALEHSWSGKQPDSRSRAYLGGMFELGVGRTQARQLAALYAASAPNDLALNVASTGAERASAASPARVRFVEPGFGGELSSPLHQVVR